MGHVEDSMFFRCFRAPLLVSSFSNAPQSWRDDKAQKGRSEKIEVNGIGRGLTKDEATKLQRWKRTYKDTIAVDAMQTD